MLGRKSCCLLHNSFFHLSKDIPPNFRFNEPQLLRGKKKVPKCRHSRMTRNEEQRSRRSQIQAVLISARFEIVTTTCLSLSSSEEPFQRGSLFPFRGSRALFQIRCYIYSCLLKALLRGCSASFVVCVSPARHV